MVQPPHPVYAARAPEGSTRHAPGARVFGLYSAVRLADPVRLTLLAEALPGLLKSRAWQSGAYQYQCISAFGGDAAFTAGLGPLEDHLGRTKKGKSGGHSNVVGFTPVIEDHTRALGPSLETAADVYGHDVVQRLMAMQEELPYTAPSGVGRGSRRSNAAPWRRRGPSWTRGATSTSVRLARRPAAPRR